MKRISFAWEKSRKGVSKPTLGKSVAWWDSKNKQLLRARRFFWNFYVLYR